MCNSVSLNFQKLHLFKQINSGAFLAILLTRASTHLLNMFIRPLIKLVCFFLISLFISAFTVNAEPQGIALSRQGTGTLYVEATINNALSASFLVDTGSGLVTLNKKTFSALTRNAKVTSMGYIAARMANGQIQKLQRFSVSSINVGGNCDLGAVEVAVIPSGANILGINALLKAGPFTISANELTLTGCKSKSST